MKFMNKMAGRFMSYLGQGFITLVIFILVIVTIGIFKGRK